MTEEKTETHMLVLVVDATPAKKFAGQGGSILLNQILDSVIAFGNAHLMQSSVNKLAVLACNSISSKFLYPSSETKSLEVHTRPGQYELFSRVESQVRSGLGKLIMSDESHHSSTKSDSLLGGAMARAMCHIHRTQRELSMSAHLKSRMLVISGSSDSALQYMTFMNVFFSAQKENVIIDCCMMDADSGLLQQGCDITGGQYLHIPNVTGLLEYLLWVFLPSPFCRTKLVLPTPAKVDYRAACFCHRQLVDIGYVCSVCLSVFCKFQPICGTCNADFRKNMPPMPLKPKKKRPKIE